MRRADSLEKTLMLGGIGGKRRRGRERMRWLDGIIDLMDMSVSELREWITVVVPMQICRELDNACKPCSSLAHGKCSPNVSYLTAAPLGQ